MHLDMSKNDLRDYLCKQILSKQLSVQENICFPKRMTNTRAGKHLYPNNPCFLMICKPYKFDMHIILHHLPFAVFVTQTFPLLSYKLRKFDLSSECRRKGPSCLLKGMQENCNVLYKPVTSDPNISSMLRTLVGKWCMGFKKTNCEVRNNTESCKWFYALFTSLFSIWEVISISSVVEKGSLEHLFLTIMICIIR